MTGLYTHFVQGTTGANFGAGILVNGVTVHSRRRATVNVSIAADADLTTRDVTLTTGTEVVTKTAAFTVAAGTPVITTITPTSGQQGQTLDVAVTGQYTHFVHGTTGASFGAGILVNGVTVHSPTSATVNVSIAADARLTTRNVTLTTGTEVVTKTAAFTVTAGTPVITAIDADERPAGPDPRRRGDGSVHPLRPRDDRRELRRRDPRERRDRAQPDDARR